MERVPPVVSGQADGGAREYTFEVTGRCTLTDAVLAPVYPLPVGGIDHRRWQGS